MIEQPKPIKDQSDDANAVTFEAVLYGARSTHDGNWKLTFEVDAEEAEAAIEAVKLTNYIIQVALIPVRQFQ